jgi:hypothetical protein
MEGPYECARGGTVSRPSAYSKATTSTPTVAGWPYPAKGETEAKAIASDPLPTAHNMRRGNASGKRRQQAGDVNAGVCNSEWISSGFVNEHRRQYLDN